MNKRELKKKKLERLAYNNAFNKENYKQINMRFSYSKEQELIEWMANFVSPKDYIVSLIKRDMKNKLRKQNHEVSGNA